MSGPITRLFEALESRWNALGYQVPLVYGYRQTFRTDLDSVSKFGGRVSMHAGGPDNSAGELDAAILQAYESGRAVATDWALFTVYCHGYNKANPNKELLQDDVADCLKEQFLGVLAYVKPGMGHYWRLVSQDWIRDPEERRYGETIQLVFAVSKAIRQAPEYGAQTATPTATVVVEAPAAPITMIEQP